MLRYIEGLLEHDPAYKAQRDRASQIEALRRRLTTLRDEEIARAFPDSPPEERLLRKDLLEEFILKKSRTKDDWFRKIPEQLRSGADSKQVGKYLGACWRSSVNMFSKRQPGL